MDDEYRNMMIWVGIALVASVAIALVVVTIVVRMYGP